jgi:hypothetical protein
MSMSYHPEEDLWSLLLRGYTVKFDVEEDDDDIEVIVVHVSGPGTPEHTYRGQDLSVLRDALRELT